MSNGRRGRGDRGGRGEVEGGKGVRLRDEDENYANVTRSFVAKCTQIVCSDDYSV